MIPTCGTVFQDNDGTLCCLVGPLSHRTFEHDDYRVSNPARILMRKNGEDTG
jgi:hypothetical protein